MTPTHNVLQLHLPAYQQ